MCLLILCSGFHCCSVIWDSAESTLIILSTYWPDTWLDLWSSTCCHVALMIAVYGLHSQDIVTFCTCIITDTWFKGARSITEENFLRNCFEKKFAIKLYETVLNIPMNWYLYKKKLIKYFWYEKMCFVYKLTQNPMNGFCQGDQLTWNEIHSIQW